MGHRARVGDGLRPTALVLRPRDAVLRPDLHCYANNFPPLLAQKVPRDAGIHSTAHPEQNAFLVWLHLKERVIELCDSVNAPFIANRHTYEFAAAQRKSPWMMRRAADANSFVGDNIDIFIRGRTEAVARIDT